jgi:bacterioferritin-associated ferredoxin
MRDIPGARDRRGGPAMIICSCNVLSDHEVRNAAAGSEAPRTAAQIFGRLGRSPGCGCCARSIRQIVITRSLADNPPGLETEFAR